MKERAYSLVELMVILAIVLILSTIAAGGLLSGSEEQDAFQTASDAASLFTKAKFLAQSRGVAHMVVMTTTASDANRGSFILYAGNGPFSGSCVNNNWSYLEPVGGGDGGSTYGGFIRENVDANFGGSTIQSRVRFANGEASPTAQTNSDDVATTHVCFDGGLQGAAYAKGTFSATFIQLNRSSVHVRFRRNNGGAIRQLNILNGVVRMENNMPTWTW